MQGIVEMFASLDGRDDYAWAVACHLEVQRATRRDYLRSLRASTEVQRAKWRAENRARAARPEALVQRAFRAAQLSLQAIERQARAAKRAA